MGPQLIAVIVEAHGEEAVVQGPTEAAASGSVVVDIVGLALVAGSVLVGLVAVGVFVWLLVSQIKQKRQEKFEDRDN